MEQDKSGKLSVGDVIDERYEVLAHIGSGGMGEVYKVVDRQTQKLYALKMISPLLAEQKVLAKRLEHEAQAARTLAHGNIVSVYDVGVSTDGAPYLLMDYIEGDSLENLLHKESVLTPKRAIPIFIQIAEALVHAQQKSIVHRDLKPSNILMTRTEGGEDMVKIVDFGIAKISDQDRADKTKLTQTGELLGTPLYMSPEQCTGEELDARSDIYSLGCIMHEVLTGKSPFAAENSVRVILKHLNEPPPQIPNNLGVSSDLKELILRCLEKHRADRYQSAVDVHIDLERILDGRKIRPHKRKRRVTKKAKSFAVAAGVALLGIVGAGLCMQTFSGGNSESGSAARPHRPDKYGGKTLAQWTRQIEKTPEDPELYLSRGLLHMSRDERTNAIDDFTQAINLKPHYLEAHRQRAYCYNMIAQYDKAAQDADKLIAINPNWSVSYSTRALVRHFREQYDESISDYRKAISLGGDSYDYYGLANELIKVGEFKEAEEAIARATKQGAGRSVYRGLYGLVLTFQKKLDEAFPQLKLATDAPDSRGVEWQELAYYYLSAGQPAEGQRAVDKAKALETFPARAYRLAGEYYRSAGQFEKAIQEFSASTSLEEYPPGYRQRAMTYISLGQWRSALTDLKKSLQLNPYSPTTLSYLARVENELGMKKESEEHITRAFSAKRLRPLDYVNRSAIELKNGQPQKALEYANKAIAADKWLKEGYQIRAEVNKALGKSTEAEVDRQRSEKLVSELDL